MILIREKKQSAVGKAAFTLFITLSLSLSLSLMLGPAAALGEIDGNTYWDARDPIPSCRCRCLTSDGEQLCLEFFYENSAKRLSMGPCAFWQTDEYASEFECTEQYEGSVCTGALKTEDGWEERVKGFLECNYFSDAQGG